MGPNMDFMALPHKWAVDVVLHMFCGYVRMLGAKPVIARDDFPLFRH